MVEGLLLAQLHEVLTREDQLLKELTMVQGMMETLLAAQVSVEPNNAVEYKIDKINENSAVAAK